MDPHLLQKQLRDNSEDLSEFCKDLKDWSNEMKRKDESLKGNTTEKVNSTQPNLKIVCSIKSRFAGEQWR